MISSIAHMSSPSMSWSSASAKVETELPGGIRSTKWGKKMKSTSSAKEYTSLIPRLTCISLWLTVNAGPGIFSHVHDM